MAQNHPDDDYEITLRDVTPPPTPSVYRRVDFEDRDDWPEPPRRYGLRLAIFAASLVVLILVAASGLFAFAAYEPERFQHTLDQALALFNGAPGTDNGDSNASSQQLAEQGSQSAPSPNASPGAPQPNTARLPIPNVDGLVMLIRGTVIALNQANRTGNYSILRELSGSDLQKANSGARLNEAFATLRERHVDLLAANAVNPRLVREPWIDDAGRLRLAGFFPSRPEQINFEMIFQPEDGTWKLYGLAVNTAVPPAADAEQPEGPAQAPAVATREAPGKTPQIERQPQLPAEATLVALARESIIALNQANATGNYSVLRELGAPGFQRLNTSAQLADSFADLRGRELDLTPVTVIAPAFINPPAIDDAGRLRLTGGFPSRPEQVNFDMLLQLVDGTWKIFGIGVNTSRLVPAGTASSNQNGSGAGAGAGAGAGGTASSAAPSATPTPRLRPNG